ncbi:MAG: hypothetical protein JXA25_10590 [Anaerolineales bacterium]|nr:hypothetical protein [Anaerolineales bacterium]
MKHKVLVISIFVPFIILLQACGSGSFLNPATETPMPTSTPVPPTVTPTPAPFLSIDGTISEVEGKKLTLCQVEAGVQDLPADCVVYNEVVASDGSGGFEFYDVPAGSYFILYDNGNPDVFDEGFEQWSGKTLKLGDQDWLDSEYFDPEGEISIIAPAGTPLSFVQNPAYLFAYNYWVLHGSGPFALAHNPQFTGNSIINMIHPVVVTVSTESTTEVNVHAYK